MRVGAIEKSASAGMILKPIKTPELHRIPILQLEAERIIAAATNGTEAQSGSAHAWGVGSQVQILLLRPFELYFFTETD